jgi:hypothetical protein
MHVEIFFETAEQAAAFNDFPVVALDGDRVVVHVDWHPSHLQSDELTAADLYEAQAEWEAEQYEAEEAELSDFDPHRDFYAEMDDEAYEWTEEAIEWEEGMHPDNLYDGDPVMDLPNDLFMVFDDPDYWG